MREGKHKTQEHRTDITPLPLLEDASHAVTVPPGRGGWHHRGWCRGQGEHLQGGTDSTGCHGGSGSSGGHGGAGSTGGHGWMASMALASARPLQPEPFYPPQKKSLWKLTGLSTGTVPWKHQERQAAWEWPPRP